VTYPNRGDRLQIRVYLPSELLDLIDSDVASKRFQSRSEAVTAALQKAYLDPDLDVLGAIEQLDRDMSFLLLAVLLSGRDKLRGDALSVLEASAKKLEERGHNRPRNYLESGAVRTLLANGQGG
jgi:Arc/MetJ-type ribon-helix-helix transcriptional regulator